MESLAEIQESAATRPDLMCTSLSSKKQFSFFNFYNWLTIEFFAHELAVGSWIPLPTVTIKSPADEKRHQQRKITRIENASINAVSKSSAWISRFMTF